MPIVTATVLTCIVTYQNLGSSMGRKMTFQQGDNRLTCHVFEGIQTNRNINQLRLNTQLSSFRTNLLLQSAMEGSQQDGI